MAKRLPSARWLLALPIAAASGLELLHPTWPDDAIYAAVAPIAGWWMSLHLLLLVLIPIVIWTLSLELGEHRTRLRQSAQALLCLAALSTTAYLALDGLGTGLLVQSASSLGSVEQNAVAAALTSMWSNPLVTVLADVAGGSFALALLCTATALYPEAWSRLPLIGVLVTAGSLLLSAIPENGLALLVSRVAALSTGGVVVYRSGSRAIPFALLVFAAALPQHVGPPAALGMLLILVALAARWFATGRSSLAADCPPSTGLPR